MHDLLDPAAYADGSVQETFAALPAVSWQQPAKGPPYWAVLGYAEAVEVLCHPETYSSAYGTGPGSEHDASFDPAAHEPARPIFRSLNLSDPPAHTALREHLDAWIANHAPAFDTDGLSWTGDITDALRSLPRQMLCSLLEIEAPLALRLHDIALRIAYAQEPGSESRGTPWLRWRRAEADLREALSEVTCALGQHLEQRDRLYLLRLLVLSSLESSTTALTQLIVQLTPPRFAQLQVQPDFRSRFIEETLREHPPLQRFARLAVADTHLGGVKIRPGQRLVVFFAAANRRAEGGKSLTFGAGPHRCPGAALARRQLRALLDFLLQQPGPPTVDVEYYLSSFSRAPKAVCRTCPR